MRALRFAIMALVFCGVGLATCNAANAATLVVDGDGLATPTDCDAHIATLFTKIQLAVNAAVPGDTVYVCPGVYNEQVAVTTSRLATVGEGAGRSIIRPNVVNQTTTTNVFGNPVAPIVLVSRATEVTIAKLTIDGSLADAGVQFAPPCSTQPFYVGIYYKNASGTLDTAHVTGIRSATKCAFGIRAETASVTATKSLFEHYGESAIACLGQNSRCVITDNTIRGEGRVTDQIQIGVIIRADAVGAISGNVISDHFFIGAKGVPQSAVGVFLVYAHPNSNPHIIRDNVFVNNQVNVQRFASGAAL